MVYYSNLLGPIVEELPRSMNRSDCGNASEATSASSLEQAVVWQPNHCSLELVIESLDPRKGECNMTIAKGVVLLERKKKIIKEDDNIRHHDENFVHLGDLTVAVQLRGIC